MLDIGEIDRAIAELENAPNHTPTMCAKLSNLYTIRDHAQNVEETPKYNRMYSQSASPKIAERTAVYGDSDFLRAASGKDAVSAWKIIDDLMDTLRVVNERVYESVLRKMQNL